MKYINLFENHSAYSTAESGLDKPNVSMCEQENEVYYNPWTWAEEYLTFKIISSGTIVWICENSVGMSSPAPIPITISYKVNDGEWTEITSSTAGTSFNVSVGDMVQFKGNNTNYCVGSNTLASSAKYSSLRGTATFDVEGNILSLVYGDDFNNTENLSDSTFGYLFRWSNVVNARNLILPNETLQQYCYEGMFYECTSLITAPELPSTTLASYCYNTMFDGCTSLTTAPQLPATTLSGNCYFKMLKGCTSLTTAPQLPATTLADGCYSYMFQGCTSLTTAPELPATTLTSSCYLYMFQNCTSLTTAPELPAETLANSCYSNMFRNCTSLTTAPELPASSIPASAYTNMFQSCTSLTTAPVLSARTLNNYSYQGMFQGCTSLTTAPELPAETLVNHCYEYMFSGCTSLNYIKAMFTTTPSNTYTQNWVKNVAATGTFVKNSAAEWNVSGANGIPTGWTEQTASS